MNCELCGEVCRCDSETLPAALAQWRGKEESNSESPLSFTAAAENGDGNSAASAAASDSQAQRTQDGDAVGWRDELSSRLNHYRARRKVRPPRYPSLSLQFEPLETSRSGNPRGGSPAAPTFDPVSNHALALDGMRQARSAAETEHTRPALSRETAPQPVR